jgi:hypothetical protein
MVRIRLCVGILLTLTLVSCSLWPGPTPTPTPQAAPPAGSAAGPEIVPKAPTVASETPTATQPTPSTQAGPALDPFDLISQAHMLATLEDLTAIQPYSGWRNSATEGEAEARDYVAGRLAEFAYLHDLGLELERQSFHVFLGTELWETRLHLTVDGQEIEVPADGMRGPRDDLVQARRFDSDGALNDAAPDPVVVQGPVVPVRSADEIQALNPGDLGGKIVFLDYAAIDRTIMDTYEAVSRAWELIEKGPSGLVLVTRFSNQQGESHGSFVGDTSALDWVETDAAPPALYVRLEDLAPAAIAGWDDLERIQSARLTWDADVFSPGESGNLVARIPGADATRAVILGAHIDSPNAPGALDDGSGSAMLLEVARILDASRTQPPIDLYLVWFGSEELGLYGASHFVATHQELLDRTVAMLQIDALSRPLDGLQADLKLVTWPYGRLGDSRMLWPDYLAGVASARGVEVFPENVYYVYSDNSTFGGFDVPHADLIYEPELPPNIIVHHACHWHEPYDTVDLVREVGDVLEQMTRVALAAALDTARDQATLRVTPRAERRALFVASHTEATHMTPVGFTELGMALAMEGFDVDLLPYGQGVTPAELDGAHLVIVLPVMDYPSPQADPDLYDEAWTQEEVAALEAYVDGGGFLVLTNSARRIKYGNQGLDANEDWSDANDLASRFGVTFFEGTLQGSQVEADTPHPLLEGIERLELGTNTAVPFRLAESAKAAILARAGAEVAMALLEHGPAGGQVLVLADVALLAAGRTEPQNLPFWQNLARYAR